MKQTTMFTIKRWSADEFQYSFVRGDLINTHTRFHFEQNEADPMSWYKRNIAFPNSFLKPIRWLAFNI